MKTWIFIPLSLGLLLQACTGEPDPRTLPGMLEYAARAIERRDPRALFRVIERARATPWPPSWPIGAQRPS
ncbi:MAG: hypothetical protein IPL19_22490 [Sandaracinaceae bacterium]|nr:hypothetical protein [Sandaracinaceae bacterium]